MFYNELNSNKKVSYYSTSFASCWQIFLEMNLNKISISSAILFTMAHKKDVLINA